MTMDGSTPMPTGARLFAAIGYALVAFFASEMFKHLLPEGTQANLLSPVNTLIGVICGWRIMGLRAGRGYWAATGPGLRTSATFLFYALLVWAAVEMVQRSWMQRYDGLTQAVTEMMGLVAEYFLMVVSDPQVPVVLVVGGLCAAFLSEWASARFA